MHREAEMIEQQLKAKQAVTAVPQPQQPMAGGVMAANQAQDYSAQWAEYYRNIGKIEEAEAIEKQMKASNPSIIIINNNKSRFEKIVLLSCIFLVF